MSGLPHIYPLKVEWEMATAGSLVVTHPAPRRTSREPWPAALAAPEPVLKLAERAREWGWDVATQYAQGHGTHSATGRPTALAHSIGVLFSQHPLTKRQAYAVYRRPVSGSSGWTWSSVWLYGPDLPPFGQCSAMELREWLERCYLESPENMAAWCRVIRERRERQALEQKQRARERPKSTTGARRESGG